MQSAAALPSRPAGNDFADWLSPILVKELRQGLKSKAFVVIFIIVQVVMILLVGLQLLTLAGGGRGAMGGFDFFFWFFVGVPLLVMMPARGLMAVSEEIRANTIDLVQLTRLTAFRIVLGKWVALVSQTLLLVAAILPYAMLRYFFGEVDVVADLQHIATLLMLSIFLTAAAIALSSVHIAMRIIILVVVMPAFLVVSMLADSLGHATSSVSFFEWGWVLPVFVAAYTYLMLEITASKIAPVSENHAAPKRLLALALGLAGVAFAIFADAEKTQLWMVASSLACGWIVLEALCERTVLVPSMYSSFARRGVLGRLAGRILYPGWASGLIFSGVLMVMLTATFWILMASQSVTFDEDWSQMALVLPITLAAVVSPVLVLLWFPRVRQPMWLYVLVQAICALIFLIAYIVAEGTPRLQSGETYRWLALFPTSTLFALFDEMDNVSLRHFFAMVSLPVCALIAAYLAIRALREFKLISQLERQCLGEK